MRLAAVLHVELDVGCCSLRARRAGRRDPAPPRRSAASAPRAARPASARRPRTPPPRSRRRTRRLRRRASPSQAPLRTSTPSSSTSREATVTSPVATCSSASSIAASFSAASSAAVAHDRSEPGGNERDGIDRDRLVGELRRLLGGEDDVRVVRQDDHLGRGSRLDRSERCLPSTGSSSGRPRRSRAAPSSRRDGGCRRPATTATTPAPVSRASGTASSSRSLALLRLLVHVRDLDAFDRADRGPERERLAGLVGVDVDLERARIADHEQRVAELLELGSSNSASRSPPRRRRPCSTGTATAPGGPHRCRPRARPRRPAAAARRTRGRERRERSRASLRRPRRRRRPPCRTASSSGVRATRSSPRATSFVSSAASDRCRACAASASSASSRITVSIVPSTGWRTAR